MALALIGTVITKCKIGCFSWWFSQVIWYLI